MKSDRFDRLLAKSLPKQENRHLMAAGAATYTGHIQAVMQSADVLVRNLGQTILEKLDIKAIDLKHFANTVKLGAYLHDWGKANQHFQEMVHLKSEDEEISQRRKEWQKSWEKHGGKQMIRHEVISGILALQVESFRNWLKQCPNADLMVAVWAATGHHLKMGGQITEIPDKTGDELKIYTHHHDFGAVIRMGPKFLGLPKIANLKLPPEHWSDSQLKQALENLCQEFTEAQEKMDWQRQKFIAAVKATVIAADVAGSALPVAGHDIEEWIQEALSLVLSDKDLQNLLGDRLKGQPLRLFQEQIAASGSRVKLVIAGCGTGKTIGAYAWAQKRAVNQKLFFCYPTMGTASQGYLDYAHDTQIESTLMHSHAQIDLEELLTTGELDKEEEFLETNARLTSLIAWPNKLMVCTVDTVLGLMQNYRKPLYSWPAISQSAFVFDEIHAYDDALFGAFLRFLKTFRGAQILLMSASMTPGQKEAIRQIVENEFGEKLDVIPGEKELEELRRYRIQLISQVSDAKKVPEVWLPVLEALGKGQKVLWVTNSVQSCIDIYRLAKDKISQHLAGVSVNLRIYHSRYRYSDRKQRHKEVIEAFQSENQQAVLAIATQVCEMSLDLSADLLVSAMAPAAALIQRMGRLNRRYCGRACDAIIYPWHDENKPYNSEKLLTGKQLTEQLAGLEISQQDLSKIAAQLNLTIPVLTESEWLDGIWCTQQNALREAGGTMTVLLENDLAKIHQSAKQTGRTFMKEAQNWAVPIRIQSGFKNWKRIKFYRIAPSTAIEYSEETGAEPCN